MFCIGLDIVEDGHSTEWKSQCHGQDKDVEKKVPGRTTEQTEAKFRARAALEKVGLSNRADSLPLALSEGEQQRVAVARAIVNRPQIILADEPTANLDKPNADKVIEAITFFQSAGVTCIIATHDESLFTKANRVIYLDHGKLRHIDQMDGKKHENLV